MQRLIGSVLGLFLALSGAAASPAEPPAEPILRIEAGMHTAGISRIAIDAQGRWLVSASEDKTARVWDLATGRLLNVLRPPHGPGLEGMLSTVAISPDGATVALGGWTQFNDGKTSASPDGNPVYLFDRASGRMLRRLEGMPSPVLDLSFSPDGRWFAATLVGRNGVRVYRTDTWALVGQDADYGDSSRGADFSRDGRLVTSSLDGQVRLYTVGVSGLRLTAKEAAPGGKRPLAASFSPDGQRIAVGFDDTPAVNVLDGVTLAFRYAPDTATVRRDGYLGSIAWSSDGEVLYAAGATGSSDGVNHVRIWLRAGQGEFRDEPATKDTVVDLRSLPGGGVAFGAGDPAWGTLDTSGRRNRFVPGPIADFRGEGRRFQISRDALTLRFGFYQGKQSAIFDLEQGLVLGDATNLALSPPRLDAPGLVVTDWRSALMPKLNGRALGLRPAEISRSLAIAPDGGRFAVGTERRLVLFDRDGRERWNVFTPSVVWAVNISGDGQTVVAALGDGTLRWYDITDGREKLAFFPDADRMRWVAWTPSGYYQASPGGEGLIGWHLNNGKDAAADFFPASRFRARFSRPDVVARAVAAPSEAEALRLADAEAGRRTEAQPLRVQAVLPPVVSIVAPAEGSAVASSTVTVRFNARSPADAPVIALRARVNGQAVALPGAARPTLAADGSGQVVVPVPAEDSEIQLFAENRNGASTPATIRLTWAGQKPATQDSAILKPTLYVLAVGVSKYANPAYNLGLAAKDAGDMARVLHAQKGRLYGDVQVRLLTDAKATKDDVLDGLEWLKSQVTSRDVGIVFMAGHGINDNTGKYFFMPHNADPDKLLRTGVPQTDIRDALNSLAGKALFFIDTCHSGNALGTARTRGLGTNINAFVNELAAAENGVVVFSASTGRQLSLEDDSWGNGAFTKAVVEGLSGKADFQKSGKVTHKGLDYYVTARVKELTKGRQSPISIAPNGVTDFPIAVVGK